MKKRFFQLVLTAVLSVSCVATGVNVSAAPLSSEGYSIEKVSHPERGAGETDGILSFDAMGEESNRNQSYVWSCVEHGNYIYLGTCWNPISGIYYRNLKNNLTKLFQNRGDENPAQKAGTVATNILNVVYNGNFPDGATSTNGTPCIMRVNKYTYETEVVYIEKESSAFVNWNGYRMAVEYNGKLYFACAGFPTSRLLQIDPETNETKVVMQKTAENSGFANGIRGLTVMDGKLLVSLATDGADPDNMFASGSQLPQAYQNAIKAMAKKDVRYKDDNPRMQGVRPFHYKSRRRRQLVRYRQPGDLRQSSGLLDPRQYQRRRIMGSCSIQRISVRIHGNRQDRCHNRRQSQTGIRRIPR